MTRQIAGLLLTCVMEKGLGRGPPRRGKLRGKLLSFDYALVMTGLISKEDFSYE